MKTLTENKEGVKVAEVNIENEVNLNLYKGEALLVKEDILVNYMALEQEVIVLDLGSPIILART